MLKCDNGKKKKVEELLLLEKYNSKNYIINQIKYIFQLNKSNAIDYNNILNKFCIIKKSYIKL